LTYEVWKLEISARLHYLWISVNHEPFAGLGAHTVQPGQAYHMNYSASYEVITHVRVGFNGYWLQQTTDEKINDINVPQFRIPWREPSASARGSSSSRAAIPGFI
jgi:hypothetical protein